MSAQGKPEEIVPKLLACLEKAKQFVVGRISENSEGKTLVSKFKAIEIELDGMKSLFPRIKHWEGKLMEQFRTLAQDIDDDVFFKQHDEANEILNRFVVGHISENSEGKTLVSKFKDIGIELGRMKRLIPRIKYCEGKLMEQFRTLEQDIDDDVFFKQHDEANEILNRLERIRKTVMSVKQLFSAVESQLMDETRTMPSSGIQFPSEEAVRKDQTISQEWSRLGVEEIFYGSKAISNFQKSFDCLESYQLKAWSLCLSIFPENSIIKKRPLIYWWIGEGMVTKTSEKTAEELEKKSLMN